MKITGKMLAGYAESSTVLAFEAEYPERRTPDMDCINALQAAGVDLAGLCNDMMDDQSDELRKEAGMKYGELQQEEVEIQNTYVTARNELREQWKSGKLARATYLEECSAVRAVFMERRKAFAEMAQRRSLEIMSEFLMGLAD